MMMITRPNGFFDRSTFPGEEGNNFFAPRIRKLKREEKKRASQKNFFDRLQAAGVEAPVTPLFSIEFEVLTQLPETDFCLSF